MANTDNLKKIEQYRQGVDWKKQDTTSDWTVGFVDNDNDTRVTEWGTQHVRVNGVSNGTVIKYNRNTGEYQTLGDESAWTDDFRQQIQKLKDTDTQGAANYQKQYEFREMANKAASDIGQHSLTDAFVAGLTGFFDKFKGQDGIIRDENGKAVSSNTDEAFSAWLYNSALGRAVMDRTSEGYQRLYDEDPDTAIQTLANDTRLSDRAKRYYAYAMINQTHNDGGFYIDTTGDLVHDDTEKAHAGKFWIDDAGDLRDDYYAVNHTAGTAKVTAAQNLANVGLGVLQEFGEASDALHGTPAVKAAVQWLAYRNGKSALDSEGNYEQLKDMTLGEAVLNAYKYDFENESRAKYDYDTGYMAFDWVLEVLSDPETWVNAIKKLSANAAAQTALHDAGLDSGAERAFKTRTYRSLSECWDDKELVQYLSKELSDDAEVQKTIEHIADTMSTRSKAYKLAQSMQGVSDVIDKADDLAKYISGMKLMGYGWQNLNNRVLQPLLQTHALQNADDAARIQAIHDAFSAARVDMGGVHRIDTSRFVDEYQLNLSALQSPGTVYSGSTHISDEMMYELLARNYAVEYRNITSSLYKDLGVSEITNVELERYVRELRTKTVQDSVEDLQELLDWSKQIDTLGGGQQSKLTTLLDYQIEQLVRTGDIPDNVIDHIRQVLIQTYTMKPYELYDIWQAYRIRVVERAMDSINYIDASMKREYAERINDLIKAYDVRIDLEKEILIDEYDRVTDQMVEELEKKGDRHTPIYYDALYEELVDDKLELLTKELNAKISEIVAETPDFRMSRPTIGYISWKNYKAQVTELQKKMRDKTHALMQQLNKATSTKYTNALDRLRKLNTNTINSLHAHGLTNTALFKRLEHTDMLDTLSESALQARIPSVITEAVADFNGEHALLKNIAQLEGNVEKIKVSDKAVYKAKLNQKIIADELVNNESLDIFYQTLISTDSNGVELFRYVTTQGPESPFVKLSRYTEGHLNYKYIREAVNELPDSIFNAEQKEMLISTLFDKRMRAQTEQAFRKLNSMSPEQQQRSTRYLARTWLERDYSLQGYYDGVLGNKYTEWKCNTDNLVENLKNIQAKAEAMHAVPDDCKPLYYSVLVDETDHIAGLQFMSEAGKISEVYKLDSLRDKLRLDKYIDEQSVDRMHRHIKLVGVNGHASGYGTDAVLKDALALARSTSTSKVIGSIDLAELKRVEQGLLAYSDIQLDAVTNIIGNCVNRHSLLESAMLGLGQAPKFSMVPMSAMQAQEIVTALKDIDRSKLPAYIRNLYKTMCESVVGLNMYAEEAGKKLFSTYKSLEMIHAAGMQDLELKTVYKESVHKKWLDLTSKSVQENGVLKVWAGKLDTIADIDTIYRHLDTYITDDLSNELVDGLFDRFKVKLENDAIRKDIIDFNVLSKKLNKEQKLAVMLYVRDKLQGVGGSLFLNNIQFNRISVFDVATPSLLRSDRHKWFDVNERLTGPIGRSHSTYNQIIEDGDYITQATQKLDGLYSIRKYMYDKGRTAPLDTARLQVQGRILDDFKISLLKLARDTQTTTYDEIYNSRLEYLYNKIAPSRLQEINNLAYNKQLEHRVARLGLLTKYSDEELATYLQRYCGNRLGINLKVLSNAELDTVDKLIARAQEANIGVNIDEHLGVVRLYLKADTDYNLTDVIPLMDKSTLPVQLEELLGASYNLGDMILNTSELEQHISTYFEDITDMAEPSTYAIPVMNCSWIGAVSDYQFPNSYVSSNAIVNLTMAVQTAALKQDNLYTMAEITFNEKRTAKELMELNNLGDLNDVERNGFVAAKLDVNTDTGKLGIHKIVNASELTHTYTTILSYNDYAAFEHAFTADEASHLLTEEGTDNLRDLIKQGAKKYQGAMLSSYLYTNPGTWVRNFVDSTLKGIMSEGSAHIEYMRYAAQANQSWGTIAKEICADGHTLSDARIATYFTKHADSVLSEKEFRDMLTFYQSSFMYEGLDGVLDAFELHTTKPKLTVEAIEPQALIKKWQAFNADKFEWVERTNRLAIYMQNMDLGKDSSEALRRVGVSQFDYSKTTALKKLNSIAPFVSFRLQNYTYWLGSELDGKNYLFRQLIKMYDFDTEEVYDEDTIRYRAWLDTLRSQMTDESNYEYSYNTFEDYMGSDAATALDYGWVRIGEKLYYKAGLSMLDAFTGMQVFADPTQNIFSPITDMFDADLWEALENLEEEEWLAKYGNIVSNVIPVYGTVLYRLMQSYRNYKYGERANDAGLQYLTSVFADLLVAAKPDDVDAETYLDRPVGYDWYNQTEEYKKTHRYVTGVSYVPAWLTKDPTTYINTYGRLEQMGIDAEQFMADGGATWFELDSDTGEYTLKNSKLMVGDAETWGKLKADLTQWGWTSADADRLLSKAAVQKWTQQTPEYTETSKPQMNWLSKSSYTYQKPVYYDWNIKTTPSLTGTVYMTNKATVKWHRRSRDIYNALYAKYGASRMAMRQNLKNYSNRSITELHRTDMSSRYRTIHNRRHW